MGVLDMFKVLIRPVLEYASSAFNSLLTATQAGKLEQMQAQALKIIFGWKVSYATALRETGTERLEERRKKHTETVRN